MTGSGEDVEQVPPTSYLVMEVLAARWRLDEKVWAFPSHLRLSIDRLVDKGWATMKAGIVERTVLVALTAAGVEAWGLDKPFRLTSTEPEANYGRVIGLDFTDRPDGNIVINVAVDETTRWGHEGLTILRDGGNRASRRGHTGSTGEPTQ